MEINKPAVIDIEKVIGNKNPRLLKILPRFVLNYIKRTIHQDEINHVLTKFHTDYGVTFVNNTLTELGFSYQVRGAEHLNRPGRLIITANHPLGGLDGLMLMSAAARYHHEVKFIVNDLLMNLANLAPLFIPVNKHGSQSIEYARKIEKAYASNAVILNFPAGLCSRKIRGKITDLEWKKNFIDKAVRYQRDIIPVFVEGHNSDFFYNLANIRKMIGIKANIEMFYLPHEMFRQKSKTITFYFGQAIPWQTFDKRYTHQQWTMKIRNHVYRLKDDYMKIFDPAV